MSPLQRYTLVLGLALAAGMGTTRAAQANKASTPGYMPAASSQAAGIVDLALIYQGGTHRPKWTAEELAPYVSRISPETKRREWLFDGFLFIEFKDGRGHEFARGYKQKPGRKDDWLWLLDRNFERERAIDALDRAIESASRDGAAPQRRRQVVLTLPEPIVGQKDWGTVDGRALDFSKPEDRIAACRWHLETALAHWASFAPKHLELAGFYWVAESARSSGEILPRIADEIHRHGKRFFWIPYWKAGGAADWRKHGFDAAYQQPNHFFKANIPDSRLDAACTFARTHGMGMEFECDTRAIQSPEVFRPRFEAYLNSFERNGAKTGAAMAYYEGGGALLQMAESKEPAVQALYHRLAAWIATRQRQGDAMLPNASARP